MTAELRAYLYAPPRSAGYAVASLPAKAPHTRRVYEIDFTALLRQLGQAAIAGVATDADAPLTVLAASRNPTGVTLMLGGGQVGSPAGKVLVALLFADGSREDVVLAQPVSPASPDIPDSAATVNGVPITVNYQPLEISDMPLLPGGLQPGDLTIGVRPGVNGTPDVAGRVPLSQLGGGGGGGSTVSILASIPLSGHRAIMVGPAGTGLYADPAVPGTYNLAGISTGAADAGTPVTLAQPGDVVVEPSWAWTPGRAVFVGPAGALTQTPPVAGISHQVGQALSGTVLLVSPNSPIRLS